MDKELSFEEWIRDYWYEHESECVLDDDCPDAEADWISNLDPDDWIRLGQKFVDTRVEKKELDEGEVEKFLCKEIDWTDDNIQIPRISKKLCQTFKPKGDNNELLD